MLEQAISTRRIYLIVDNTREKRNEEREKRNEEREKKIDKESPYVISLLSRIEECDCEFRRYKLRRDFFL